MSIVPSGIFLANSCNYIFAPNTYTTLALLGLLNSRLINWYFRCFSTNSNVNGYEIDHLPIPHINEDVQKALSTRVQSITNIKKNNSFADTSTLEFEIDILVYHLYSLTYDEVLIVDPETPITREEYENNKTIKL